MGESNIEWTERTWNPIVGCSLKSPGCIHCYAMGEAARQIRCAAGLNRSTHYAGTVEMVKGKPVWTGELRQAPENILLAPMRRRIPTTWFVNSMGDLFHEDCPDDWIDRVFAVMVLAPQHIHQVLTKRADRMKAYLNDDDTPRRIAEAAQEIWSRHLAPASSGNLTLTATPDDEGLKDCEAYLLAWPLPNVWLGVSTERQQEADERIPLLLQTPAAVRFISAEPLLGPINLDRIHEGFDTPEGARVEMWESCLNGKRYDMWADDDEDPMKPGFPKLDWVIAGGESGTGARPMHPDWARNLRDQCASAEVPFFFKQWGAFAPVGWVHAGSTGTLVRVDGHVCRSRAELAASGNFEMNLVGKARAGRLLDGVEYNGMPRIAA